MIRILSVVVYNANNSNRVYSESFRSMYLDSNKTKEKWKLEIEKYYRNIVGYDVSAYITSRSQPKKKISMTAILANTAFIMGQSYENVISKSRKKEHVNVRKIACMILYDSDFQEMDIERGLPFKNRVVYRYIDSMENRIANEPGFEKQYEEIRRKVMEMNKIK